MEDIAFLKQKIEAGFVPCFHQACPCHADCMRWQGREFVPTTALVVTSVNTANPQVGGADCPMYCPAVKVRMAYGFTGLLDRLPHSAGRALLSWVIANCNRTYAYEYRNGSRPMPPTMQQRLTDYCRQQGYTEPVAFDRYAEEYDWDG